MRNVDGFDFTKFDIGGKDAVARDNKLTGEEVSKARNAGWCVWDGMMSDEKPPRMEENFNGGYDNGTTQVSEPSKKQTKEKVWKPEENFGPNSAIDKNWGYKPQSIQMPIVSDNSNDKTFNILYDGNDPGFVVPKQEKFISIDSELGKQIGRPTMEFRESVDGKYEPVFSEPDPLGNRKILGYKPKNIWDVFK